MIKKRRQMLENKNGLEQHVRNNTTQKIQKKGTAVTNYIQERIKNVDKYIFR
jgi:hypothetical protein